MTYALETSLGLGRVAHVIGLGLRLLDELDPKTDAELLKFENVKVGPVECLIDVFERTSHRLIISPKALSVSHSN